MPQFFISEEIIDGRCVLRGDDFHHLIRVRRIRPGERILLREKSGNRIMGRVAEIFDTYLTVDIIDRNENSGNRLSITLCACLLKGKNFDLAIRMAVEIGVDRILPVISSRTIPGREDRGGHRIERWRKIAREASKQSMRSVIAKIENPVDFNEAVGSEYGGAKIIAHIEGPDFKNVLRGYERPMNAAILTGPEGGFTDSELAVAEGNGWVRSRFGFTSLRAETAAVVIPAILVHEWSSDNEDKS